VFPAVRGRFQRLALLVAGALLVAAAGSGCGREESPDLANGKELFVGKGTCGSCHTLQRAGTKGTQGPDLDEAFGPARRDGLGEQTVEGVVMRQIANPRMSSIMQPDLVTGDDARDVAAYVALVAGQSGKDTGALANAGKPKTSNKPIAAKGGKLTMDADPTGALAFASTRATAPAGSLQVAMGNESSIQHNIALRGPGGALLGEGDVVGKGGTSKFTASVKAGKYEYLCTVPGHAAGGMKGTLTVE
jgi:plastocyanin